MTENIGKVFSGYEFKQLYKTDFYKILTRDLVHNGYQYIDGINICQQQFNPKGECSRGGLYFTELNKILIWLSYYQHLTYIVKVEILDDSQIYVEKDKFKANNFSINLSTKCEIKDFSYWNDIEFCKLAVQQNFCFLEYVVNQTEEICKLAVQKNGYALKYVKNQTEELCELAIQNDIYALLYVKNKPEKITKSHFQDDYFSIGNQKINKQPGDWIKMWNDITSYKN